MSEFRLADDLRRLDGPVTPDGGISDELWMRLASELDESRSTGSDGARLGRKPPKAPGWARAVAAAVGVLVIIGAVAAIRPFGASTPPLADIPNLESADVDGPALESVFAIPGFVPEGFEPVLVDRDWMDQGNYLVFRDESGRELAIATVQPRGFAASSSMVANRLRAVYPHLSMTETTVRGRPAFLLDGGDPDEEGWTSAVVVLEDSQTVSQILAIDVAAADMLAVARSLTTLPAEEFQQWASTEIDWHLNVDAWVDNVDSFVGIVEALDGVNDVTVLPSRRFVSDPSLVIQYVEEEPTPTTTMPLEPNSPTTTTLTEPQRVQLLVTLHDPGNAENIAAAVARIPGTGGITYSPAVAGAVTQAFFDAVLGTAQVVHDDPVIHQPAPGPDPEFDTAELGTEVPLIPATAAEGLPLADEGTYEWLPGPTTRSPMRGPILHIGALEDGTHLVLTFDEGSDYVERTVGDRTESAGSGTLHRHRLGEVGSGGSADGPTYVRIRVPLETSVVVLTDDNGDRLWQRPIAGHALIPVDTPVSTRPSGTITALAADGTTIGEWERGG